MAIWLATLVRSAAWPELGNVDRGIIPRGLAPQQIAPDFDGGFGFLYVLEKGELGVVAAPAAGLEQFGEVLEPPLGKRAPARDDVAAPRHVWTVCHEPARKRERRTRTQQGRINQTRRIYF